jgi:hypothetical protein
MSSSHQQIRQRSVDSLQKLYAIIVALAISISIQSLFLNKADQSFVLSSEIVKYLPCFFAFMVTLIPFYHGMNRHLDVCYIERDTIPPKGALLFDFIVFFVESFVLFTIAATIRNWEACFALLGVLLAMDTIWAFVSHLIHYRGPTPSVIKWSAINVVAVILSIFLYLTSLFPNSSKPCVLFCVAFLRALLDYVICWEFYFPTEPKGG